MTTISLPKIKEMAERYNVLKSSLEERDRKYNAEVQPDRDEMEALKQKLIESFKKTGLPSIRTSDDALISYAKKPGILVTNTMFALKWAMQNQAIQIDKKIAAQIIKELADAPPGFERVESEYLSVKNKNKEKDG